MMTTVETGKTREKLKWWKEGPGPRLFEDWLGDDGREAVDTRDEDMAGGDSKPGEEESDEV